MSSVVGDLNEIVVSRILASRPPYNYTEVCSDVKGSSLTVLVEGLAIELVICMLEMECQALDAVIKLTMHTVLLVSGPKDWRSISHSVRLKPL